MSAVHIFMCINRKCKLYKKDQQRPEFNSLTRCSKCKKAMKWQGEQGKLDFPVEQQPVAPSADVKKGFDALAYELVNAVFSVKSNARCVSAEQTGKYKEEVLTGKTMRTRQAGYAATLCRFCARRRRTPLPHQSGCVPSLGRRLGGQRQLHGGAVMNTWYRVHAKSMLKNIKGEDVGYSRERIVATGVQ